MTTTYRHTHRQTVPAQVWEVTHNLGTDAPVVDCYIEVGGVKEKIITRVVAVNNRQSEIHFSAPRIGVASFR